MKYIKYDVSLTCDELLSRLADNDAVNKNINITDKRGFPVIHVKNKGNRVKLTCEFQGGATKDNAFISGTMFFGRMTQRSGYTELRGIITTAPIFHFFLIAMLAVSVCMCILNTTFNAVPICLVVFDAFMYKDEFRKQGIIERYIHRALKRFDISKK